MFLSEAGVDFQGSAETLEYDPDGDGFHDILWAGIFAESLGTGMSWWWDNVVDPTNLYFHFGPVAAFVRGIDFPGEGFTSVIANLTAPDGRPLRVFQLRGATTTLIWIRNQRHQWTTPDPAPLANATLVLDAFAPGTLAATWLDTRSTLTTAAIATVDDDGRPTLPVPSFSRDIALKLTREKPPLWAKVPIPYPPSEEPGVTGRRSMAHFEGEKKRYRP